MNGTAIWQSADLELMTPAAENEPQDLRNSRRRISALKKLTLELVREVQSIGEVKVLDMDSGLDFYNEVTTFEIDLITRALVLTGGHQARAAKLLNLKGTTLNSKIKSYNIKPESFAGTSSSWNSPAEETSSNGGQSQRGAERSFA
ncbi:MAG TPA: helix-turn-helix domain-containing protein [Pyrinomonadaceae bacterium]|nr:helix-turn-helix domain-containing protein [Pyrinomonadaceae bacterium]